MYCGVLKANAAGPGALERQSLKDRAPEPGGWSTKFTNALGAAEARGVSSKQGYGALLESDGALLNRTVIN